MGGFKDCLPGKDLRPNRRDALPDRGPLAYMPQGHGTIGDFGAPRKSAPPMPIKGSEATGMTSGSMTTSPASASFCPGWVEGAGKKKETRVTIQIGIKRQ